MTLKVRRNEEDLRRELAAQLGFLRSSAAAFDSGFIDEAKRLAVAMRILLHDTPRSRGLLAQLDAMPAHSRAPVSHTSRASLTRGLAFCGWMSSSH